jgi:hypothetical protein
LCFQHELQDILKKAAPIEGGIGMNLLKKMGWQPGQGLGRNNDGSLTPLMLTLKFDTKGLASKEDVPRKRRIDPIVLHPVVNASRAAPDSGTSNCDTSNTLRSSNHSNEMLHFINTSISRNGHPVSILQEVCAKYGYSPPVYEMVDENGPAHRPTFLTRCLVSNVAYTPAVSSSTKKQSKSTAAQVCLQALADFKGIPFEAVPFK